jgi:hypothetical protein
MSRTSLASAQAKCAGPAFSKCARRLRRRVAAPRVAGRGGSSRVGISVSIVVAASDRFSGGAPPPNRLDEQAARDRVFRLASETTGGRGAMEAIQGCLTSMPGMTNHRLMLFRHPSLKCPLDTVALNLVEPRWVVAFDAIANAPKRPGDPPFCFGITHPALVPPTTPPGEDVVAPKPGDVGLVCQVDDVYHDNKTERMYVTSRVVGRFEIDRLVGEHPFFVAETARLTDEPPTAGSDPEERLDPEGLKALEEEELRVWRLLETLESLSKKTNEEVFGGGPAIDYDAKRFSPVKAARPAWDENPPSESERPEMFSWAVVRRLNLDQRQHLDAVRTTYTTARLAQCADALQEGVDYLAAVAALRDAEDDQSEEE